MKYDVSIPEEGSSEVKDVTIHIRTAGVQGQETSSNETIGAIASTASSTSNQSLNQPNPDLDICVELARAEYEYPFRRSERLDNKVYILLTVCAFIFVLLTSIISSWGEVRFPKNGVEVVLIIGFAALTGYTVVNVIVLLRKLIVCLSSITMHRFDSQQINDKDMTRTDAGQVARYVISKYEKARDKNNNIIDARYDKVDYCVKLLIKCVTLLVVLACISVFVPKATEGELKLTECVRLLENEDDVEDSTEENPEIVPHLGQDEERHHKHHRHKESDNTRLDDDKENENKAPETGGEQ